MNKYVFFACCLLLLGSGCKSEEKQGQASAAEAANLPDRWIVGFYNVENLFDIHDEPVKLDEDFTPKGRYNWTTQKYLDKIDNLARAIGTMGENGPDILGLAEVENAQVVKDMVQMTELKDRQYEVVHEESPDMRGIDVALIYNPKTFAYQSHKAVEITFPAEPNYTSRKILHVSGMMGGEKVHILVNHWPSRRGGQEESEPRRLRAAEVAAEILAEIRKDEESLVLIMGDMNDDPFNRSIAEVLQAKGDLAQVAEDDLYNPMTVMHRPEDRGTLTYKGKWNLFDQILVSEDWMDQENTLLYQPGNAFIHGPEFMQVGGDGPAKDMPRRAIYRGEFQERGFSDHFPVYLLIGRQ
ncbi:MAG: endonuclease/exonuclease/phosphatase family protein [Bacteroidota bacterium]